MQSAETSVSALGLNGYNPSIKNSADHQMAMVDFPLLIFVGVTGVGKSTTLTALAKTGHPFHMLPDRRTLTDEIIIPTVQAALGEALLPITDRTRRFAYTRRYRELYPAGMVHALAQLQIPAPQEIPWAFDGLRGADEVRHAAEQLPKARFVVLDAPDVLRVERLLDRGDRFDQVANQGTPDQALFADLPGVDDIFDADAQAHLRRLVSDQQVSAAELRAKLAIVVAERQNYDPAAAIATLAQLAAQRTLVIDTSTCTPDQAARRIVDFWKRST